MKSSVFLLTPLALLLIEIAPAAGAADSGAEAFCRTKWAQDGGTVNTRMFQHCVEEAGESEASLAEFRKQHGAEAWFRDISATSCDSVWTKNGYTQPDMVLYCYKRELESFTELQYQSHLASFNAACAEACFSVWKSKPGLAFAKTFECYRARAEAPRPSLPKTLQLILGVAAPATETAGHAKDDGVRPD